ncbi:hypothetical protein [Subtercola endophyticus]|uniref:hypothetical protein n=1 Tax=Subtercola endophyticus TaxID=2895559 RepID=UPI001E385AF9|nr:hypothetical protein [Subtercola endophyticus]UFS60925.1 hypothetical protein LQ955_09410 [Subtercola endophyticus]
MALTIAVCVLIASVIASVLIGLFGTTIYHYTSVTTGGSNAGPKTGFNAQPNQFAFGVQMVLGSAFGLWALIQGLVATIQNRGRRFGIVAMIIAVLAPIVSLIVWTIVGLAAGQNVTL